MDIQSVAAAPPSIQPASQPAGQAARNQTPLEGGDHRGSAPSRRSEAATSPLATYTAGAALPEPGPDAPGRISIYA